jgi:hypothetical protein
LPASRCQAGIADTDHAVRFLLDYARHQALAPHDHRDVEQHHQDEGEQQVCTAVLALAALGNANRLEVEAARDALDVAWVQALRLHPRRDQGFFDRALQ